MFQSAAALPCSSIGVGITIDIQALRGHLGRTLARQHEVTVNWNRARVTNGPTAPSTTSLNAAQARRVGFHRFAHHRIRALLYASKLNWTLLAGVPTR